MRPPAILLRLPAGDEHFERSNPLTNIKHHTEDGAQFLRGGSLLLWLVGKTPVLAVRFKHASMAGYFYFSVDGSAYTEC